MQPTIVLVHGAFAESSSWDRVIDPLLAEGHRVVAAANPLRSLAADAASVSDLVRAIDGPVVLVAHSYGGAVMSNVDADAGEIVGLVYANAFAPDAGEHCFAARGHVPRQHARRGRRCGRCRAATGRPTLRRAGQLPRRVLPGRRGAAGRADGRDAAPATQEALVEPSGERPLWKDVPSWFLIGEEDRIIPRRAPALHGRARRRAADGLGRGRVARRLRLAAEATARLAPRPRLRARRRLARPLSTT